jgi:hypothetical protein
MTVMPASDFRLSTLIRRQAQGVIKAENRLVAGFPPPLLRSMAYQTNFNPSCICREGVSPTVEPITAALGVRMELLASFRKFGAAKLG